MNVVKFSVIYLSCNISAYNSKIIIFFTVSKTSKYLLDKPDVFEKIITYFTQVIINAQN